MASVGKSESLPQQGGQSTMTTGLPTGTLISVVMGSVGRIDGAWVGAGGGNIVNIMLDTPNNNIIFLLM